MTPCTPGLDPERLAAVREVVNGRMPKTVRDYYDGLTDQALAADDAHARSRGLVCQGDGLRAAEVVHAATCMDEDCTRCDALLAALPSSLLDNPEADRAD